MATTKNTKLQKAARARAKQTGESYTTARMHILASLAAEARMHSSLDDAFLTVETYKGIERQLAFPLPKAECEDLIERMAGLWKAMRHALAARPQGHTGPGACIRAARLRRRARNTPHCAHG